MSNLNYGLNSSAYDFAKRGMVFSARAIVTAPVIFSTAAGTGGPLLWNGSKSKCNQVNAVILGITCAVTTVTTVAAALGITGGSGQTAAPSATTAIDTTANLLIGAQASKCTTYRVGTVSAAGTFFLPIMGLHTGALTVDNTDYGFFDLGGMIVVPPDSWVSIATSATATTTVAQLGLIWAEVPI